MEPTSDDDDRADQYDDEEEGAADHQSEVEDAEPESRRSAAQKSSQRSSATSVSYKSNEIIIDSDEELNDTGTTKIEKEESPEEKGKGKAGKRKVGPKEPRKAVKKLVKPVTEEATISPEEDRINKLKVRHQINLFRPALSNEGLDPKTLAVAAGNIRVFNASTGAEKTLSPEVRIQLLETALTSVGLMVKSGGSLPSIKAAKVTGEKRAMEKEMKEISGAPVIKSALRGGKKRGRTDKVDEEEPDGEERRAKPKPVKKPFGSFLGNQSDSSE